jgi:protein-disulfide isomerase
MSTTTSRPSAVPNGAPSDGDGVLVGAGPVRVDLYVDFLCPFCRRFEETAHATLTRLVADHAAQLVYHPLGFLDRLSTTAYSSRASSASGCAADADAFVAFKDALFAHQPPEGGPGLSDEQLIALGATVGLTNPGFAGCVQGGRYVPWTRYVTARAIERGVSGTPTALVNGTAVPANGPMIAAAVAELAS